MMCVRCKQNYIFPPTDSTDFHGENDTTKRNSIIFTDKNKPFGLIKSVKITTPQLHRHRKSVKSVKISGSFRYIELSLKIRKRRPLKSGKAWLSLSKSERRYPQPCKRSLEWAVALSYLSSLFLKIKWSRPLLLSAIPYYEGRRYKISGGLFLNYVFFLCKYTIKNQKDNRL